MKSKGRRGKGASREAKKKPDAAGAKSARPARPESREAGRRVARSTKPYTFLDHPADVGFVARGHTLTELFESAAAAVLDYGWELGSVRESDQVNLRARAATLEDLLFSWLAELLYLADAEHWVFKRVHVRQLEPPHAAQPEGSPPAHKPAWEIRGAAFGERFEKARHRARTYIKAVTYHQLAVEEIPASPAGGGAGWQATVFLDV
ncbi:MAG: archease [Candidatus Acidiferrales bacterium]